MLPARLSPAFPAAAVAAAIGGLALAAWLFLALIGGTAAGGLLLLRIALQLILHPGDPLRLLLLGPAQAAGLALLELAAPGLAAALSPFFGGG